ncbi:coproporphyrinogen III oxidase [Virgisporangium aliadipatigenens]|uniref:Heme chaperone HemW n=1 Tax=Virgisporangium aliadipatigenens TaxID=741659 RepID=A0A8J3YKJ6_9ACTN|nr:radical SAM family heme chaperone HemW [Virgisporangium aliadipatigenens]GIJ47129.1 coproporphyrinogen III oxidase [Virgisporangium aliadipatigenens]
MPGALPSGEPVPATGPVPPGTPAGEHGFGVYAHVPFCASRCGYCDFNTYTPDEAGRDGYVDQVLAELRRAASVVTPRRVDTVFVGGGTPTLLAPSELGRILAEIDRTWGLADGAEITTEANPESVDPSSLRELRAAGFTRISLGMQSAAPHVLKVLERRHTPGRAVSAALEARDAGFDHVNLDLIYGTPGERPEDFAASLDAVVAAGVDHVSAYALIVEDGTRLATAMRKGVLPYPDDDVAADRYLAAERALTAAGFSWYEVSNWARDDAARCRHNLLYWAGGDWWGLGPGAHSHVGGVRWWNVRHPSAYARAVADGWPAVGRETLTADERHTEDVMLRVRLRDGLPLEHLDEAGRKEALRQAEAGLLDPAKLEAGRVVLTLRGRLLADGVVRDLLTAT